MLVSHYYRRLAFVLLVAFALGWLPLAPHAAAAPPEISDPVPTRLTLPPETQPLEPPLPTLSIEPQIAPDPLIVGETAVITLTIANAASDPADALEVTMPVPQGALALGGSGTIDPAQGWRWSIGRLDGYNETILTATLQITRMPRGAALLLKPQATAGGLSQPVIGRGGAIVSPRDRGPARVTFAPGTAAELRSRDGRLGLRIPAQAYRSRLTIQQTPLADKLPELIANRAPIPPLIAGNKRGFGVFYLDATDDTGTAIHRFDAPVTIRITYTPEQLEALGISEGALTLFSFDEQQQRWVTVHTTVDRVTQTASATIDHFSPWQLGDGSSASSTFIPSLQGWQVSTYTGAANYSYPFELPVGPGGIQPHLQLTYSSSTLDGDYRLTHKQGSWVGLGWDLNTGYIALNKRDNAQSSYYSLVMGGQSSDLVRGNLLPGAGAAEDLQGWYWYAADETFMKVRYQGPKNSGRWIIWTPDGTKYEFSEIALWGWGDCSTSVSVEPYKWMLSKVTDTHGNTITYTYNRLTQSRSCGIVTDTSIWPATISWGANLTTGAIDRYKVDFSSSRRRIDNTNNITGTEDMEWDFSSSQYGGQLGAPHETRKLDRLTVYSMPNTSWERMLQYRFTYNFSLYSEGYLCEGPNTEDQPCHDGTGTGFQPNPAYRKLTLTSLTRLASNASTALPPMTFTYETNRGNLKRANGGWNRLKSVNNGQGGTLTFTYANIAQVQYTLGLHASVYNLFFNRHRVLQKTATDGRGNSYTTNYAYQRAAVNWLGANIGEDLLPRPYPNSAAYYYSYADGLVGDLAVRPEKEFRGHAVVTETLATGGQIIHSFDQGEGDLNENPEDGTGCIPADNIDSDACFVSLRKHEFLKGREWQTAWRSAGGALLKSVVHLYELSAPLNEANVPLYGGTIDYTAKPTRGLWRAFSYERTTAEKQIEGTSAPQNRTTVYTYNPAYQTTGATTTDTTHYGNAGLIEIYGENSTIYRTTKHWYATKNVESWNWSSSPPAYTIAYIVNRPWAEQSHDGSGNILALTHSFYDDTSNAQRNSPWYIGNQGDLTRVAKYRNIPLQPNAQGITLYGPDTTYTYDWYGNRINETTYKDEGSRLVNGSTWTVSLPGGAGGITPVLRTTTIEYDDPATTTIDEAYSGLPRRMTNPAGHVEQAGYNYEMRTLTSVIDANNNTTTAGYDGFGRLIKIVRPGDSSSNPTIQATYYDSEQPFRYKIERREIAGNSGVRVEQQFYDGLGRLIQAKSESSDGTANLINIVIDKRYDGLDRVVQESQPRYVTETATSFTQYSVPPGSGVRWTSSSYDALNRILQVIRPDGSRAEEHIYGLWEPSPGFREHWQIVTDANRHMAQYFSDEHGRLVRVRDYSGDCTSEGSWGYTCGGQYTTPWIYLGETVYAYSPLDLLRQVTDIAGNQTSISYDSLGRKTSMSDPDMGAWAYLYDTSGNLTRQTDARGQRVCLFYDSLNRLTGKYYNGSSDSCPANPTTITYSYDAGTNGKGRRTGMTSPDETASWVYDTRGRRTQATHAVAGLTRTFQWSYDSADRIRTMTYPSPSNEVLTYAYDAGWRPTGLTTSRGGSYVSSATYTALDQPKQWSFANSVAQIWSYNNMLAQLDRLQIGSAFDRAYGYDPAGNITSITDNRSSANNQSFSYDHHDRLTSWTLGSTTQGYGYNAIGNLIRKGGLVYEYADPNHKHAVTSDSERSFGYDANGNQTSINGITHHTWNAENQASSLTGMDYVSESYGYDGDGERVKKTRNGTTTIYLEGLWEEVVGGTSKALYPFNGAVVATRDGSSVPIYLHGDHLGSISLATSNAGGLLGQQEFDPWGAVRSTSITQTSLNYTSQRLDLTGLLYYHARY